jgi:hypothetical protein
MSIGENKTLLLRYIEAVWEQRNPHAARGFLAHDYQRQVSPTSEPLTRDEQIQRLVGFRAAFPDIQITVEEVVAEGQLDLISLPDAGHAPGRIPRPAPHREAGRGDPSGHDPHRRWPIHRTLGRPRPF